MNLQELRRLAEQATRGPWCVTDPSHYAPDNYVVRTGHKIPGEKEWNIARVFQSWRTGSKTPSEISQADAAYIAAANPATLLKLLDRLDAAEKVCEAANELFKVKRSANHHWWDEKPLEKALSEALKKWQGVE